MTSRHAEPVEQRAVVLAPVGRDAEVVVLVLSGAGHTSVTCETIAGFLGRLNQGAALGILTEEVLQGDALLALALWMERQPPWSDFPLLVLAGRRSGPRPPASIDALNRLGNVVLLERPLSVETLVSAARGASRSRARQYQTRFHLDEQQRGHAEIERLYAAESRALRAAAESREALLAVERRAREQAELASRTKDEFLATLSHELRTPLSAILGWVYVLRHREALSAEQRRGVDVIERNARAQSSLIDDLLDMSRIIAGNIKLDLLPLAPLPIVEATLALLQPQADAKSLQIKRNFAAMDADAQVLADAPRLQQIVSNLLSNAIKFTPEGGTVTISAATPGSAEGGSLTIEVADTGEGIATDFLPFIFDRFRQADGSSARRHGGLGLGLSIVRNLVVLHHGEVEARSDGPGHGSVLTVRLPLHAAEALANGEKLPAKILATAQAPAVTGDQAPGIRYVDAPADKRASAATGDVLRGRRILLVEDEPDSREMLVRIFVDRGAEVWSAASADEATTVAADHPPDLLISDIGLPGVDGYALLREFRGLGHRFPAIAVTAFAHEEDRRRAYANGFAAHLAKPFEVDRLIALACDLIPGVPVAEGDGSNELAGQNPGSSTRDDAHRTGARHE